MENTQILYELIIDVWRLIRDNYKPETEEEWEELLEEGKKIVNAPEYKDVQALAIHWINNYVFWLEGKLK